MDHQLNSNTTYATYMTYKTYTTNKTGPGYEKLMVYWLATSIFDLAAIFCDQFIDKRSRTHDQMVQAARSGKQNIVEGSLEKSVEGNLKLTGVARASFGELLEDFRDFLRQRNMAVWDKNDPRVMTIRRMGIDKDGSHKSYESYKTYLETPESFSNLMITLCFIEGFLLDRMIKSIEEKFVREGGFRENLFKKREEFRRGGR